MAHSIKIFPTENRLIVIHEERGQEIINLDESVFKNIDFDGAIVESYVQKGGRFRFLRDGKNKISDKWDVADKFLKTIDLIMDERDRKKSELNQERPSENHFWVDGSWQEIPEGHKYDEQLKKFVELSIEDERILKIEQIKIETGSNILEYHHDENEIYGFDRDDILNMKTYLSFAAETGKTDLFWTVKNRKGEKSRVPHSFKELQTVYMMGLEFIMSKVESAEEAKQLVRDAKTIKQIKDIQI